MLKKLIKSVLIAVATLIIAVSVGHTNAFAKGYSSHSSHSSYTHVYSHVPTTPVHHTSTHAYSTVSSSGHSHVKYMPVYRATSTHAYVSTSNGHSHVKYAPVHRYTPTHVYSKSTHHTMVKHTVSHVRKVHHHSKKIK